MPTPIVAPDRSRSHLAGEFVMQRNEEFLVAVVSACAAVAYADGWVTREERRRLLGALRSCDALAAFPVEEVGQLFDEVTDAFARDHDTAEQAAFERVEPFRGAVGRSREILRACTAVASADTQLDGEERTMLLLLCERLDLDPADFDLADARGPRRRA